MLFERSAHSVLPNEHLSQIFNFCLPDWRVQLHAASSTGGLR